MTACQSTINHANQRSLIPLAPPELGRTRAARGEATRPTHFPCCTPATRAYPEYTLQICAWSIFIIGLKIKRVACRSVLRQCSCLPFTSPSESISLRYFSSCPFGPCQERALGLLPLCNLQHSTSYGLHQISTKGNISCTKSLQKSC